MLRVQGAGTHGTAQGRVLVLDAGLTQQACVMPLLAASCSTLDTYSAVLKKRKEKKIVFFTGKTLKMGSSFQDFFIFILQIFLILRYSFRAEGLFNHVWRYSN